MNERPPHNDPEDEQRFRAADFGYGDDETFEKIGNGKKNDGPKEKKEDKKPKRGGKREVEIKSQKNLNENSTQDIETPKPKKENKEAPLKTASLRVSGQEHFLEPNSNGNYLINEETQEIYPPKTVLRGTLFGLTQTFAFLQPEDSPTGQFSIKVIKPAKYENSNGKLIIKEKGRVEVSPISGKNQNVEDKKTNAESTPIETPTTQAPEITTKKSLEKEIPPESQKIPKEVPTPTPPAEKPQLPKVETTKISPASTPEKLKSAELPEEGYFPLRRDRLKQKPEAPPQSEPTTPTEKNWSEKLSDPELLEAARIAIAAQETPLGIFQFMKKRSNYSAEKLQDLYDRLKSAGVIKFGNGAEKVTITKKDLSPKTPPRSENLEVKNKPNSSPQPKNKSSIKFGPKVEARKTEALTKDFEQPRSKPESNIESASATDTNKENSNTKTPLEAPKPQTEPIQVETEEVTGKTAEEIRSKDFRSSFKNAEDAEFEPIISEDPKETEQNLNRNESKKISIEEITEKTKTFNQKYEEEFEKAKAEDDVNAPEIRDFVQKKLDLLADIRRLNWEISSTLEKTAGDKNLDKLKALYESNSVSIKERFDEIDTINQQIGKTEGLKSPETSTKPTPEEIKEFQDFIKNIKETTKTHLENIETLISAEEKKPPKGLTLEYLKQADDALRALWNASLETPIDTVDLKEVRKILSNLATTTGNYIGQLGEKISKENKSIQNAEKIKRYFEIHDDEYKSITEKVGGWLKKYRPLLVKTAIFLPLIFSLQTQETQKEGVRGSVGSKVVTIDSVQPSSDPLFEHSNLSSHLKIGQQPSLDSLFNKNPK